MLRGCNLCVLVGLAHMLFVLILTLLFTGSKDHQELSRCDIA